MEQRAATPAGIAFALIYFTFFLDNVLLTVLVPIIPDWVRGEALALWAAQDAPLAALLNTTVRRVAANEPGSGGSQAVVGLVLGAKAGAQLLAAPLASAAVCRAGPAPVLRAATALLALAALAVAGCSVASGLGGALCVGGARAAQGAGAALAGVAGLALAAAALPPHQRDRAIGALLGAVALGVLVGYPFGGAANALWSRKAPFLLIAAALLVDLAMQYMFLDREEFCQAGAARAAGWAGGVRGVRAVAARGAAAACAGAVLLTTSVMAALEPCLPLWITDKFHPQRGLPGGGELRGRRGAAAGPRARGAGGAAGRRAGRARRAARHLRVVAGAAARGAGAGAGRDGRGAGAGAGGAPPLARAAPRRAAAGLLQHRLHHRAGGGRPAVVVRRVRGDAARAGRAQPALHGAALPRAAGAPAVRTVGGDHSGGGGRGGGQRVRRRGHAAAPAPVHALAITGHASSSFNTNTYVTLLCISHIDRAGNQI